MADRNVPPRRSRDDRGWDGYQNPLPDRYHVDTASPYAAPYAGPGGYAPPAPPAPGPQWVGPDGLGAAGYAPPPGTGLPDLDDDDEPRTGRRRALAALGAAAVVAGGAALAMSPQVRGLFGDDPVGDATGTVTTDGTAARPSGQQPSTVRTYTEQNESYMGSRAGAALKRNSPSGGRLFASPAAAASATPVTVKTVLAKDPIRHLASRATFGATPKVLADIRRLGIDDWLREQLAPEKIAPTKAELKLAELPSLKLTPQQLRDQRDQLNERGVDPARETIDATIARQIWSDRQLFEVMVDFWNDFLHVAADFDGGEIYRNAFDRDVIRKHALGSYPDMLVAANKHPALLLYLNQNDSRKDAVNENLARENLELYSVGVDGGYTEKDVRQAALLQTGRGVENTRYVFRADRHYLGKVKILGFSHANNSADPKAADKVIDQYIRYLALHPSTAAYVARNLATRFVSDTPPKSLVDRLAKAYTTNRGQIGPVLATMFRSSEFWAAVGQKVRRPMEYLVATYRTLGVGPNASPGFKGDGRRTAFAQGLRQVQDKLRQLGQYPMGKPTPDGYADVYVAWTSAGTMVDGWNEAGDLLAGWRTEFTYAKPERLVAKPPATAGAYVDALALRLVHQKLSAREKALVLGVAGVTAGTKVDATLNGAIAAVARTILASPQHHLR
ncbi:MULTISPECIES: DUF1800 domain-containing protein [Micromonospora]|uniref:DUF1800 domain-containing protein n=1 Tax=Micromonospora solifontis TaxID=2487138 RepID=A0ABX9WFN4_9ACTN|nr:MULTISPECIES: DUF1800 domain-containing protein [Micromonospora]NES13968.1 DUF1800 domain-containing protein [Micromonospora sp. PPF5-17B]NES37473.1 DUF1800 domain-containing protein [Micromonospora solifontis]NES54068.1 DUF1800 domain-containing protein [Micromonospora sp. PPF5-6]RNL98284.1 DUF1800 domain-containing protein [Micromonospora solifontis]